MKYRYVLPFSVQIKLGGRCASNTNIVLGVAQFLDANIARTFRYHDHFFVARAMTLLPVYSLNRIALAAVALTDAAGVFQSCRIDYPIATDFLEVDFAGCY